MGSLIGLALPLIQRLITGTSLTSPIVKHVIDFAIEATPIIIDQYQDLKPIIKNIIKTVKADPAAMDYPAELAKLEEYEAIIDAEFDEAAKKALAEDKAEADKN